jgi:hypothetical protein
MKIEENLLFQQNIPSFSTEETKQKTKQEAQQAEAQQEAV